RERNSNRCARADQQQSLLQYHPEYLVRFCAKRHANPDLIRSPRHGIGNQPVQPEGGQQHGCAAEEAYDLRHHLLVTGVRADSFLGRCHSRNWQTGSDFAERLAHFLRNLGGIACGADHEVLRVVVARRVCPLIAGLLRHGQEKHGGISERTFMCSVSCTTPTIWIEFFVASFQPIRCPTGFSFGKYFRANVWFTTATTVAPATSCGPISRPSTAGMPIASK